MKNIEEVKRLVPEELKKAAEYVSEKIKRALADPIEVEPSDVKQTLKRQQVKADPPHTQAELKTDHLKALDEMEKVAAHGKALGMAENDIKAFQKQLGETNGMTVEQLTARMGSWKKATEAGRLKWGNPLSKPTYGHAFLDHGTKLKPSQLIDKARSSGHQIGQWANDKSAAQFIADVAKRGPGAHDVSLPGGMGRSFLEDGTELTTDMARVVVKPDGSVRTAFPFNSAHRN